VSVQTVRNCAASQVRACISVLSFCL